MSSIFILFNLISLGYFLSTHTLGMSILQLKSYFLFPWPPPGPGYLSLLGKLIAFVTQEFILLLPHFEQERRGKREKVLEKLLMLVYPLLSYF